MLGVAGTEVGGGRSIMHRTGSRHSRRAAGLAAVLLVTSLIAVADGAGTAHAGGNVWNSSLSVVVESTGNFSLGAKPNPATGGTAAGSWSLTYGWPGGVTSATTIRVNGTSRYLEELVTVSPPTAVDAQTNRGVWMMGAIQITQVVQIVPNVQTGQLDVAQVSYVLANTSSAVQNTGVRMMVDTMINGNDGAPFRVPGGSPITTERTYTGTAIPPALDVFSTVSDTSHVASIQPAISAVPPDRFSIAYWAGITETLWDYSTSTSRSITGDSAYALWWNERPLAPGEAITFTSAYGLGQLSADTTPPLSVGLSGPTRVKFLNGVYASNPFNIVGTIRNSSNAVANNVVVTLTSPAQLSVVNAGLTPLSVSLGNLSAGQERQVSWKMLAALQQFDTTVQYSMTVTSSNAATKNVSRSLVLSGVPGVYVPLNPQRLVDSRTGRGIRAGTVGAGEAVEFQVSGLAGVPANARTVVLNLTGAIPTQATYFTLWPSGENRPTTSNHNLAPGDTAAVLAIVKIGANGKIALYNDAGAAHVIVDVMGYFLDPAAGPGSRQKGLSPARLVDTRSGAGAPAAQIAAGGTLDFTVLGVGGVPADATAVVLNVTGVAPSGSGGYLTVWPAGEPLPLASNLNLGSGQTRANLVIAKVGAGGRVSVLNQAGPTHLVVDVFGYFSPSAGAGQVGILPQRALDTRSGIGTLGLAQRIPAGGQVTFRASGFGAVPDYASSVVLNIIAINSTEAGFFTVYPTGEVRPWTSNLNMAAGEVTTNEVIAKVGVGGSITIFNGSGTTDIVVDVMGYFA